PERAAGRLPPKTLEIELLPRGDGRLAVLSGEATMLSRVARSLALRDFLGSAGWGAASRRRFVGDASARFYETVNLAGEAPRVLMDAPPLEPGPPVRGGKTYVEIAHTARSTDAFLAIGKVLAEAGIAVPAIYADDPQRGFVLLEHLGSGTFLDGGNPVRERYVAAAELLAFMHVRRWSRDIEVRPGVSYRVPPFDREAMAIEVELLLDWYVPFATGKPAG